MVAVSKVKVKTKSKKPIKKTYLQRNKRYATIGSLLGLSVFLGAGINYKLKNKFVKLSKLTKDEYNAFIDCTGNITLESFQKINEKNKNKLSPKDLQDHFNLCKLSKTKTEFSTKQMDTLLQKSMEK